MFVDKNLTLQIFGSLMKKPDFLSNSDKYFLMPDDFSSIFERNIFSAIFNLYQNGATRITTVDIDNYIKTVPGAYTTFNRENGIEYLEDCEELSRPENFDYYYTRLKKLNSLRDLNKLGYSVKNIYSTEISEEAKKINARFETLSISDIFDLCKKDIAVLENKYNKKYTNDEAKAADGIDNLIEELKLNPEVGANLPGHIMNTIVRGARRGKFYLKSAASGAGKTRGLVGDACYLAYPVRYDEVTSSWIQDGSNETVLYVVTEQDVSEIQTLILSYLSGVNEEKLLYHTYNAYEGDRIIKAARIMKYYQNSFHIVKISNPSIASIKSIVRKYYFENHIENLFYDYIFSSPGLLTEFRDLKIREDVVLNMLSTSLKDLASDLGIFVSSSTQLNRGEEDAKTGIKNQNNIRGAISIIDKCDIAYIFSRTVPEELEAIEPFSKKIGIAPNQVADLYKVRRGRFVNVRIWSYFDYGTCRKKDLFITYPDYSVVEGFESIRFMDKNVGNFKSLLDELNTTETGQSVVVTTETGQNVIVISADNKPIKVAYEMREEKDIPPWEDTPVKEKLPPVEKITKIIPTKDKIKKKMEEEGVTFF